MVKAKKDDKSRSRTTLFYNDQLVLTASVMRNDADLGRFFRYVIKTIQTGEKPEFGPNDGIIEPFFDNWYDKYLHKVESDQNANRLKALGRRAEIAKSKQLDVDGFVQYANSAGYEYTDEELAPYLSQFTGTLTKNKPDTVTSEPVQQEKPKFEDPAKVGFFKELWQMFPKDRQKDIESIPYGLKEMIYNTYGLDIKTAVQRYVETLTDAYHGHSAKTFFIDELYKEYLPEEEKRELSVEEEGPLNSFLMDNADWQLFKDGKISEREARRICKRNLESVKYIDDSLLTDEEWHDWQTGRLSKEEVLQICKEKKESGEYNYFPIDDNQDNRQ